MWKRSWLRLFGPCKSDENHALYSEIFDFYRKFISCFLSHDLGLPDFGSRLHCLVYKLTVVLWCCPVGSVYASRKTLLGPSHSIQYRDSLSPPFIQRSKHNSHWAYRIAWYVWRSCRLNNALNDQDMLLYPAILKAVSASVCITNPTPHLLVPLKYSISVSASKSGTVSPEPGTRQVRGSIAFRSIQWAVGCIWWYCISTEMIATKPEGNRDFWASLQRTAQMELRQLMKELGTAQMEQRILKKNLTYRAHFH